MDTWVVSMFWLLWLMLLWTSMYKFMCGPMFSIVSRHIIAGPYGNYVYSFKDLPNCFLKDSKNTISYISPSSVWCIYHYSIVSTVQNCFTALKVVHALPIHCSCSFISWQPLIFLPSPPSYTCLPCPLVFCEQLEARDVSWFIFMSHMVAAIHEILTKRATWWTTHFRLESGFSDPRWHEHCALGKPFNLSGLPTCPFFKERVISTSMRGLDNEMK